MRRARACRHRLPPISTYRPGKATWAQPRVVGCCLATHVPVVMLARDSQITAPAVAAELGIKELEAEVLWK